MAFSSGAINLAPNDGNRACVVDFVGLVNCPDVFVHDRATGTTTRVSVASDGTEADRGGTWPSISADGRHVAFLSSSGNLGAGEPATPLPFYNPGRRSVLFLHDRLTGVTRAAWRHVPTVTTDLWSPSLSASGEMAVVEVRRSALVSLGGHPVPFLTNEVHIWDVARPEVRPLSLAADGTLSPQDAFHPSLSADGRTVSLVTPRALDPADTNDAADIYLVDPVDEDRDGMPTVWEQSLGLNGYSSTGMAGPTADPDSDGRSNIEEFRRQTHPTNVAAHTRYFAEGATSAFFETRLALANPGTQPAAVHVRFDRGDGTARSTVVTVPPRQSRKVTVGSVPGMATGEFATVVETDRPVVVERLMWWSAQEAYGTHADRAIVAPALRWYFAEGATTDPFDLFYLLQNPNDEASEVRVRYLRAAGAPLEKTYTLAPRSRTNIWVDLEQFGDQALLASAEVSAVIDVLNSQPIIAERAMYRTSGSSSRPFDAGHEAAGVTEPATEWFLAEGATGEFFDLFVLLANPSSSMADVEITYLLPSGATVERRHLVGPASRFTVWVDQEAAELASTAVSMRIVSRNDVPLVVERAMWWPGTAATWAEAHASVGSTASTGRWVVADGVVQDDPAAADTYVLIANVSPRATQVRATLLYDDGGQEESRTFDVAAQSRFTLDVRAEFVNARGRGFAVLVESLDATPLVAERLVYNDAGGVRWAAGANALGTPVP